MRLNPFETPQGIQITREPVSRLRPHYTKYHPVPMMVPQEGVRISASNEITALHETVWPVEIPLVPPTLKESLNLLRQKRTAAKLGSAVISLQ
ncbi:MAG: hypothetical protein WD877_01340 [Candidatus Saccharimonadales bacterium]